MESSCGVITGDVVSVRLHYSGHQVGVSQVSVQRGFVDAKWLEEGTYLLEARHISRLKQPTRLLTGGGAFLNGTARLRTELYR